MTTAGRPARRVFPRGIAAEFEVEESDRYISAIRIHGGRYGTPRAPDEDFSVALCDGDFNLIAEFNYPYAKFGYGKPKWTTFRMKPTEVPEKFVICLNFNPTGTKGVYVSHDAEGNALVGLPGKKAGAFTGGDWMIRPQIDVRK